MSDERPELTLGYIPYSLEAEQAVLGAVLYDNSAFDRCGDLLAEKDFFTSRHRTIWNALAQLINACKPADLFTVHERVRALSPQDDHGGVAYLSQLSYSVPSGANARYYAEIVREKAVLRSIMSTADQAHAMAREDGTKASEKLDRIATMFSDLQAGRVLHVPQSVDVLMARQLDHWSALASGEEKGGMPTGFPQLDDALNGGLRPGKVYVLAARPSVGKSSLAQATVLRMAAAGVACLFLTQEMEPDECIDRAAANLAGVDYKRLQTGQLDDMDWGRLSTAAEAISRLPLHFDGEGALTLAKIRGKCVALRRAGIKVVVLDYLQLCDYAAAKGQSTNDALGLLSKGLKAIAKQLGLAFVVLSQLNREVEKRKSPEPTLADLRDSGAIEQDADVVMMLWRARTWTDRMIMGLSLPKNRQGQAGVRIALEFFGQYQQWHPSTADINPDRLAQEPSKGL